MARIDSIDFGVADARVAPTVRTPSSRARERTQRALVGVIGCGVAPLFAIMTRAPNAVTVSGVVLAIVAGPVLTFLAYRWTKQHAPSGTRGLVPFIILAWLALALDALLLLTGIALLTPPAPGDALGLAFAGLGLVLLPWIPATAVGVAGLLMTISWGHRARE